MKETLNQMMERGGNVSLAIKFKSACVATCQNILARISAAREAIFDESFKTLRAQEHLLRLALNEAEAVSWETDYPHLVFPALATEKVQTVIAWNAQQRVIRRPTTVYRRTT